jgi:hypothetical protein
MTAFTTAHYCSLSGAIFATFVYQKTTSHKIKQKKKLISESWNKFPALYFMVCLLNNPE